MKWLLTLELAVLLLSTAILAQAGEDTFNAERGCWQHRLISVCQAGPTMVEVLQPSNLEPGRKYPVLYILPVEVQGEFRFGDGLAEARKLDLTNRLGVICVAPSFTSLPWYGNHATNPAIRQEEFMIRSLVPDIDRRYPTQADAEGRWLFGFSKSGWGAYTLLLRHPETFGYAAAWDAPLMLKGEDTGKGWGPLGIAAAFGARETFLQFLPTQLARENAGRLKARRRLVLGVGADWKSQVEQMHDYLDQLAIPHVYRPDLTVKHRWDTGWFEPMAEELAKAARVPKE